MKTEQKTEQTWIERQNGQRIDGPFSTFDDARRARVWIERVMAPETFWIRTDSESASNKVRVGTTR